MPSRLSIFIWMTIGSSVGGYIPVLWGADFLSYSSLLFSGIGGIVGVIVAVKIAKMME